MVWLILTVGALNLGLGYLAAVSLAEPPPWAGWRLRLPQLKLPRRRRAVAPRVEVDTERIPAAKAGPGGRTADHLAPEASAEELPSEWLAILSTDGMVARSLLEAAAQVLWLAVGRYREQLLTAEDRARSLLASGERNALKLLAEDLRFLNQAWMEEQTAAADMLAARSGRLGRHEATAQRFEQELLDGVAELQAACRVLEGLDGRAPAEMSGKLVLEQIGTLVDQAHELRDRTQDVLAAVLGDAQRLESLPERLLTDPLTGLQNRAGLESALAVGRRQHPGGNRQLSAAVVDIDRFGWVNQRLGTRAGDRTLAAVARLIDEVLAAEQGRPLLVQVAGQAFCLVLGETSPEQASALCERLRQTVEAVTFQDEGLEFDMTLSCGIVEIGREEPATAMLARGAETVKFAKRAGRNRCAIADGKGCRLVEPQQVPVKGRVVPLEASS